MADGTLGWAEILSRTDEGRKFLPIVNRLRQVNEIIPHLRWMAASNTGYHKLLVRTDEPRGYWRSRGDGFKPEHSESGFEIEPIGLLGTMSEIKDEYLRESKNAMMVRYQEDLAFMDGLSKTFTAALFYASQGFDSRSFDGLATRMHSHTDQFNVKSGGASGTTQSIWILEHGGDGLFCIFPAGVASAGIAMTPRPPQYVDYSASDNSRVWTHFTEFEFSLGMCVKHHRATLRFSNLASRGSSNQFSLTSFIDLIKESWNRGRQRAYITRDMWAQLQLAALTQTGVQVRYPGDTLGSEVFSIFQMPFSMVEQLGAETPTT